MNEIDRELGTLLKRYTAAKCSKMEFNRLLDIIESSKDDEQVHQLLKKQWEGSGFGSSRKVRFPWYAAGVASVAAAAVLFFAIVGLSHFFSEEKTATDRFAALEQEANVLLDGVTQVKLPDGSKVMLRDGSRLEISSSFEGNTREIRFEGEAYFEIFSDTIRPFIIHTGNVKTTVLGTAFSIKALPYEKKMMVTVVRGKVKVENDKKLLAVLEADDQLVYNMESNQRLTQTVEAAKEVDWKSHDIIYRDTPFGDIARELAEMYGVKIVFNSPTLPQRLITGSLDDRDSIGRILDILCTSQRAFYVIEEGVYVITPLKNIQNK